MALTRTIDVQDFMNSSVLVGSAQGHRRVDRALPCAFRLQGRRIVHDSDSDSAVQLLSDSGRLNS